MRIKTSIVSALLASTALTATLPAHAQVNEILVTATRREQAVTDVPYNISAYSSQDLARNRILDFSDLSRMVPGLVYSDQGPAARGNNNTFVLRGLNANSAVAGTGNANLTVAAVSTYLGETPVFFPMTFTDIERVEVLRGPQGTLYGSGAASGTIRFIPKKPDTHEFYAELDGDLSLKAHSDELNWGLNGVVNIPIAIDKMALRVAWGYDALGGFIDANALVATDASGEPVRAVPADPASGFVLLDPRKDVNDSNSWFVRSTLLLQLNDNVDVQFSYQRQEDEQDDQQIHNPFFAGGPRDISTDLFPGGVYPSGATVFRANGEYDQSLLFPEPYKREVDLFNLEVNVDFGFASLTSSTSYYENDSSQIRDVTGFFESTPLGGVPLSYYYGFFPRMTVPDLDVFNDKGFVQELRLVSNWDKRWNYVVGVFYQDLQNKLHEEQSIPGINDFFTAVFGFPGANPSLGDLTFSLDRKFDFEDIAIFGELSLDITDRWQITGGVRAFWQESRINFSQILPFCGALCASNSIDPLGATSANVKEKFQDQIFKANTSYDISDDIKVYFTFSEGFRRGGANGVPVGGVFASLPQFLSFKPDKSRNYEIGLKGSILGNTTFALDGYYINWKNFQFDDFTPSGFSAVINGDKARSLGVEFESKTQLTEYFDVALGYSYTDAEVTKTFSIADLPPGGLFTVPPTTVSQILVFDGDPLPGVPKHSFTVASNYVHPLPNTDWNVIFHVNGNYRSKALSTFNSVTQGGRQFFNIDGFSIWDASVSLTSDRWSLGVFADNIFDELGTTAGLAPGLLGERSAYFYVTQPRTIGLKFSINTN